MISQSNEFFINMKDVPPWDRTKHFFEQPLSTIQFYEEEWKKMREGVRIGGIFIHPWLYYHTNFHKINMPNPIPDPVTGRIEEDIVCPPLRDNEWYMAEMYAKAEHVGRGLFMFGSRRFSKTTMEASILLWNALVRPNTASKIFCGTEGDITSVRDNVRIAMTNIHPFLSMPMTKQDWNLHLQFGYRDSKSKKISEYSNIHITNLAEGRAKGSGEKGAGGSPSCVIIDEVGKFDFLDFYLGLLPSIATPTKNKAVILLSGTGGSEVLSADARKVLSDPERYKIIPMDWDILESKIKDKSQITWGRKVFGMFIPPQMAYEEGVIKNQTNLADYLGVKEPALEKIAIEETNWELANGIYKKTRKDLENDKASLAKETIYHPLDPEECFVGGIDNPFPALEAKRTLEMLLDTGNIGKSVDIALKQGGGLEYSLSSKDRIKFPFEGGIHNAPVVIYGEPPTENPERNKNVAGLDPYKQEKSNTDSVGVLYILERKTDISTPIEVIKASYASRPSPMAIFNRNCESLCLGYNAECFMEAADVTFLQHLESRGNAHQILAYGVDWSKFVNPNSRPNNRFGYYPTVKNKEYVFSTVVNYCWEKVLVGIDDEGNPIEKLGVELIPDPDLLQEIIQYKAGGNFDRIVAFGSALAWARWLDKNHILPARKQTQEEFEARHDMLKKAKKMNQGFGHFIPKHHYR